MAGNFDYDRKKKIQSSVGGKLAVFLLWREIFITTGKKRYITTGKKRYSRLSDGCAVLAITTGKKKIQSSVLWVRDHYYNRKKKIQSSVWRVVLLCQFLVLAGNGQFFVVGGKFKYDKKKKIQSSVWRVRDHYYVRKKKIQSSVWRVRDQYYDLKKKDTVVCLAGAQ